MSIRPIKPEVFDGCEEFSQVRNNALSATGQLNLSQLVIVQTVEPWEGDPRFLVARVERCQHTLGLRPQREQLLSPRLQRCEQRQLARARCRCFREHGVPADSELSERLVGSSLCLCLCLCSAVRASSSGDCVGSGAGLWLWRRSQFRFWSRFQ